MVVIIDPAAYKLIKFIKKSKTPKRKVYEQQFLWPYLPKKKTK